jgi:hypothetical protein
VVVVVRDELSLICRFLGHSIFVFLTQLSYIVCLVIILQDVVEEVRFCLFQEGLWNEGTR